ncbi:MAG: hypothetical protein AB7W16_21945 [Candidatus Obscuribacterales bacterium]
MKKAKKPIPDGCLALTPHMMLTDAAGAGIVDHSPEEIAERGKEFMKQTSTCSK